MDMLSRTSPFLGAFCASLFEIAKRFYLHASSIRVTLPCTPVGGIGL
jgi:hypothetical protein